MTLVTAAGLLMLQLKTLLYCINGQENLKKNTKNFLADVPKMQLRVGPLKDSGERKNPKYSTYNHEQFNMLKQIVGWL